MNVTKKITFLLAICSLFFATVTSSQAQERDGDGTTIFLPMIVAQDSSTAMTSSGLDPVENLNPANATMSISYSAEEQQRSIKYWTTARIEATTALVVNFADISTTDEDQRLGNESQITGPYGNSPAGLPEKGAELQAQKDFPTAWADDSEIEIEEEISIGAAAVDGTAGVYDTYELNRNTKLWKLYPHVWVGRVSFRNGGISYSCSGSAISGNILLTAAHCIYDTEVNRWSTDVTFAPAYRSGKAPYGVFPATNCWILTSWANLSGSYNFPWMQHDVALCNMGSSKGKTLNQRVGYMGREWNASYSRHVYDMGFPFVDYRDITIPDAGKYLKTCVAETFQQGSEVRGMGCNWGGGISGGPWMTGYKIGVVSGWATGVNSGGIVGQQNTYGARFNSNNIVPLCDAAGC